MRVFFNTGRSTWADKSKICCATATAAAAMQKEVGWVDMNHPAVTAGLDAYARSAGTINTARMVRDAC
jgi:hypothetical protein